MNLSEDLEFLNAYLEVDNEPFIIPVGDDCEKIVKDLSKFKHVSEGLKDPLVVKEVKKIDGYFDALVKFLDPVEVCEKKEYLLPYPPLEPAYIPYYAINILQKGYEIQNLVINRVDCRRRKNVTIHSHVYISIDPNTWAFLSADLRMSIKPERFEKKKKRVRIGFKSTTSQVQILEWNGKQNCCLPKLCADPFWFLIRGRDGLGRRCRGMIIGLKLIYIRIVGKLIITFDYLTWGFDNVDKKWNIK